MRSRRETKKRPAIEKEKKVRLGGAKPDFGEQTD